MSKQARIASIVLSGIAIGLCGLLVILNYPFDTTFVTMTLGKDTSRISRLGPDVRVPLADGGQLIKESPVYFNLRVLPWYSRAQIIITFDERGSTISKMGGQTAPGFNYFTIEPTVVRSVNEGTKAIFDFNLADVYQQKNMYRFLIDTEKVGEASEGEVVVKEIKVFLFK